MHKRRFGRKDTTNPHKNRGCLVSSTRVGQQKQKRGARVIAGAVGYRINRHPKDAAKRRGRYVKGEESK